MALRDLKTVAASHLLALSLFVFWTVIRASTISIYVVPVHLCLFGRQGRVLREGLLHKQPCSVETFTETTVFR